METQEKPRQKMQKGRLYWTLSRERCESPMKGVWSETEALSHRSWACGSGNHPVSVLAAVWAWKEGRFLFLALQFTRDGFRRAQGKLLKCWGGRKGLRIRQAVTPPVSWLGGRHLPPGSKETASSLFPSEPAGWCCSYCPLVGRKDITLRPKGGCILLNSSECFKYQGF